MEKEDVSEKEELRKKFYQQPTIVELKRHGFIVELESDDIFDFFYSEIEKLENKSYEKGYADCRDGLLVNDLQQELTLLRAQLKEKEEYEVSLREQIRQATSEFFRKRDECFVLKDVMMAAGELIKDAIQDGSFVSGKLNAYHQSIEKYQTLKKES